MRFDGTDELVRRLVDHLSAMVGYWDAEERCVFANRAYESWLGATHESLRGRHLREVLGAERYARRRAAIDGALRGEPQQFERVVRDGNGGPSRVLLTSYVPDVEAGGGVRGFFVLITDVTLLKEAERARVDAEKRLAGIVEIAADAIICVDEDGNISLYNRGAEATFLWTRDEALGRPLDMLLPARFRGVHRGLVRAFAGTRGAQRTNADARTDVIGLRKDGSEFEAEAALSRVVVEDGHAGARDRTILTVSLRDVSEQKRSEREREATLARLRESEERQRLIIDEAPIGKAIVALDGRFVRVNRALCDIVGYARDELLRLTFRAIAHPDDRDADIRLADELARGTIPRYHFEKRFIRKDGLVVPVMLHASVLRDGDGRPLSYIAQIEDITEQKRSENQQRFLAHVGALLAASSLDLESTLRTVADAAVEELADLCNVELVGEESGALRRVVLASRPPIRAVASRLAGYPRNRERERPINVAFARKETITFPHVDDDMLRRWAEDEEHLAILRAIGVTSVIIVPLVARDTAIGAIALTATTSTQRRFDADDVRVTEELARSAALAIENARLYRATKRATQARDEILGVVAHDLRNPLSAVTLQAAQLRRAAKSPDLGAHVERAAEHLERAANRMNRLISDLLDVTRLDAGRLSIELVPLAPAALLADARDAHLAQAVTAGISLVVDADGPLPDVRGDRERLLQVLENLVGNALRFTPSGGTVTLRARSVADDVVFSVADTGAGVAPDELPHLFDRFWQGRAKRRGGAGLGLSIVKGVVEAHGGRVDVTSTPGRGTTFSFTIPSASKRA